MSDAKAPHPIGSPGAPAHQIDRIKDRRRPGRIHDVNPALIPLLRHPTDGLVADPADRFQIAAEQAASSYPAVVWRSLSPSEQTAAIYGELCKLDEAAAALSLTASQATTKGE
jgi:hypothetical protein